jgi:hypothetical protein
VFVSGRLRSDWKMVSSDGHLNITAGGLCCRSCADGRGLPGPRQPGIPGLTSGLPRVVQGPKRKPRLGGAGFSIVKRGGGESRRFKNRSLASGIGSKGAATIDRQRLATHRRRLIGPVMAS